MINYFIKVTSYVPKNKAHKEIQAYVKRFHHMLIDAETKELIKNSIRAKLDQVNAKYTRCQDIDLSGYLYDHERIAIDGNFYIDIEAVKSIWLTESIFSNYNQNPC